MEYILNSLTTRDARVEILLNIIQKRNDAISLAHELSTKLCTVASQQQQHDPMIYQRLINQLDKNQALEHQLSALLDSHDKLKSSLQSTSVKLQDALDSKTEKDHVIEILRDELSAHQLELVHKESKISELNLKIQDLNSEIKILVDRWVSQKHDEALKLNDANDFITSQIPSIGDLHKTCFLPSKAAKKFTCHEGDISCIQVSKDGKLVATGASDKNLIIHDCKTGHLVATLSGALQGIMSIDFNQNGDSILGTSNDNSIKLWNLSTFRLKHSLTGHLGKVYAAKFIESYAGIISGSHDRTIKIWDLNKAYCTKTMFTLSSCNDLIATDADGSVIVSGHLDNNLRIWDTRSGNMVREITRIHAGQITGIEIFNQNKNHILSTSRDNTIKLVDLRTFEVVSTYEHENFRVGMNWSKSAISPDGSYIASGSQDGSVFFWDTASAKVEKILKEHSSPICGVSWSMQGGSLVYSAEKDKNIVYWC